MSDIAIKVENLSKLYRLGSVGTGSLGTDITRWWASVRGKEDPFAKIATANDRSQKATSEFVWSLKDLDFEIKKGEAVGIIGKNGAGKSTLLKILSRTTSPTTGSVKIKGRVASLLEVGTGFSPDLTGRENIFMNGSILGMRKSEIASKLDEIIEFSGVAGYIDTPVKRYSSGMYVRLAFAVAAHLEPDILIVDEVLAVGDADFQKKCIGKMQDVNNKEGRTVIFVSHQMGTIAQLCNKGIFLVNGGLKFKGSASESINYYLNSDSHNNNSNSFVASEDQVKGKDLYIKKAVTLSSISKREQANFAFEDQIVIKLDIVILKYVSNCKIAVGLLDKFQNRVFTTIKDLDNYTARSGDISVQVELPGSLIAPNSYSFHLALFVPNGQVFDAYDNKCLIQITDTGTEFSTFEGLNYGNFIVNCQWA